MMAVLLAIGGISAAPNAGAEPRGIPSEAGGSLRAQDQNVRDWRGSKPIILPAPKPTKPVWVPAPKPHSGSIPERCKQRPWREEDRKCR